MRNRKIERGKGKERESKVQKWRKGGEGRNRVRGRETGRVELSRVE
jgi:hypothetical protein